ncbi:7-methylguanosine phosphate-specific 5'-nucleotidase [Chelonus insularis]|uniref:7-methylguanosine phosphate-specific 5'-nucleotidase n=1 Tax=Chelonus insularis TaxID=460826 RepID=UPI00158CCDF1|nr:7-methylguanosine phosphate-specific 5'-nucleotidase [Chelonus insularis]
MKPEILFNDIPECLNRENVYIRNKDDVLRKIKKIQEDGPEKLQVVTDFDRTVTKQHVDGKDVLSSFGIFFRSQKIPETLKKEEQSLFNTYRPIEVAHDIVLEEKIKAMEEWMMKTEQMLKGIQMDVDEIDKISQLYSVELRNNTQELIKKLDAAGIPVLVFSAGLGDVVQAILKCHDVLLSNVKVISNFLNFNCGKLDGFKNDKLIHVFNKNEHSIDQSYYKTIEERSNVILMGDMTGDAAMADGHKHIDTILKIGFLYDADLQHAKDSLQSYMEAFDIVLFDDQTMDVILDIIGKMI